MPDGQTIKRPVIRLFNDSVILTRIAPGKKETSMIFRPRPGWQKLKQALEATSSDQKWVMSTDSVVQCLVLIVDCTRDKLEYQCSP